MPIKSPERPLMQRVNGHPYIIPRMPHARHGPLWAPKYPSRATHGAQTKDLWIPKTYLIIEFCKRDMTCSSRTECASYVAVIYVLLRRKLEAEAWKNPLINCTLADRTVGIDDSRNLGMHFLFAKVARKLGNLRYDCCQGSRLDVSWSYARADEAEIVAIELQ